MLKTEITLLIWKDCQVQYHTLAIEHNPHNCDADWAGNIDDRKSNSSGCFYVGNNLVSWSSKKQNSISLSSSKVEYIAAGSACTQLL